MLLRERIHNEMVQGICGYVRAESRFAPSQWGTALFCNDVSHWLGENLMSALYVIDTAAIFLAGIQIKIKL